MLSKNVNAMGNASFHRTSKYRRGKKYFADVTNIAKAHMVKLTDANALYQKTKTGNLTQENNVKRL
jgi:hypothetical protein